MTATRESVQQGLDALALRLDPIIEQRLSGSLGSLPWTTILTELDRAKGYPSKVYATTDLHCQLRMITQRLGGLGYPFDDANHTASVLGGELRIVRNRWAHGGQFTALDAWRTHDFCDRLLDNFGDEVGAADAALRRNALLAEVAAETGGGLNEDASESSAPAAAPAPPSPLPRAAPAAPSSKNEREEEHVAPDSTVLVRDARDTPTIGGERVEFEPWVPVAVGDVSVLDELPKKAAKEKVRAVAAEIVEFEGPIHIDRLAQLVALSFDLQRVHETRAKKIRYQVKAAGLTIDESKFVWPAGIRPESWREFRPNSSDVDRPFLEISPIEVSNAARFITDRPGGAALERAELESRVLQTFGRKRRTKQFMAHLKQALDLV